MKLDSSVSAVITGGASGLGAATARALAAKGVKVALFDLQEEKGLAVAAEIGGIFCECNVTDDASVDAALWCFIAFYLSCVVITWRDLTPPLWKALSCRAVLPAGMRALEQRKQHASNTHLRQPQRPAFRL